MNKRSRWIIVFGVLLASLAILFTRIDSVRATFDVLHAMQVYDRVDIEIIQTTPAGRYYRDLSVKHLPEAIRILDAHPEHYQELLQALLLFVPESEALLDGEGDKVYVSSEHVASLQAELDWFASMGSPALQEDIQKERLRLPPDQFVGMTMSDAWEYINSKWTPDMVVQPSVTSVPITPTPVPQVSGQPILVVDKTLAPGSNGKWAYYVVNGVYLEYSTSHCLEVASTSQGSIINVFPYTHVPNIQAFPLLSIQVLEKPPMDDFSLDPTAQFPVEHVVWQKQFRNDEFAGVEFIVKSSDDAAISVFAILYSSEDQVVVGMQMQVRDDKLTSEDFDYATMLDHEYEFFQHMAENIHMQRP